MNIIEAAKAMTEGKTVVDPMGFKMKREGDVAFLVQDDGTLCEEPAWTYVSEILSDKWTVLDE